MKLDLATIQGQFDAVRRGAVSREQASAWACELREADDRHDLTITPEEDCQGIWEALLFLESYDMKNAPDDYLYHEDDLVANWPK